MRNQGEKRCPNCGEFHTNKDNGYCQECSARFGRWGMFTHIDKDGVLSGGGTQLIEVLDAT